MPSQKIMLIRHAEKPDGSLAGVDAAGAQNPEELIVRGWQRSGALVRFFTPLSGTPAAGLAVPQQIYATGIAKHSKSLRPQHTVLALATLLNQSLVTDYDKGDETALAGKLVTLAGATLVAWQHEDIPTLVNAITGNDTSCPQHWPGDRFDVVWVLDGSPADGWSFSQVPQMLLAGDSAAPIPFNSGS